MRPTTFYINKASPNARSLRSWRNCLFNTTFSVVAALCMTVISGCQAKPMPTPTFTAGLISERSTETPNVEAVKDSSSAFSQANKKTLLSHVGYLQEASTLAFKEDASETEAQETEEAEIKTLNASDENAVETSTRSEEERTVQQADPTSQNIGGHPLALESVLAAAVKFYPEIEAAIREFEIAQGEAIQAEGGFDTKLKASSENTPVGFYETYRSNFGIEQPTFNGGSLFASYRFGRGDMEPWYLERNTNELGELKLGVNWALLRGRAIDSRRVALWQANLKQQGVEPLVLNQLIQTLRDAEVAYWNWVAAGQMFQLNQKLLTIAESRVEGIEERIKAGDVAEITRTDNDRSILSREVKLLKAKAKLASAAIKLSLFYRDSNGTPMTPDVHQVPEIGQPQLWEQQGSMAMVSSAFRCRPEIQLICLEMKTVSLDLAKARNDFLPQLNAQVAVSQDFGDPTSASAAASSSTQTLFVNYNEKDEFQVDARILWSQSLQRRKASGKVRALDGKLQQLHIKRAFLKEKIEAEVQANYQLTAAANEQIQVASRSLELAQKLSEVARQRYEEGDVDFFEIIQREKQELESAIEQIESAFSFHVNRANLNAAVGCVEPEELDRLLR